MPRSEIKPRCCAVEPVPTKPRDYDGWLLDLGLVADSEGMELFCFALLYAPETCVRYLSAHPAIVASLVARARWADRCAGRRDLRRVS